jgi:hypothetical protein
MLGASHCGADLAALCGACFWFQEGRRSWPWFLWSWFRKQRGPGDEPGPRRSDEQERGQALRTRSLATVWTWSLVTAEALAMKAA